MARALKLAAAGAIAAFAFAAPAAQAARPATLPVGQSPGLALDGAGVAHVAWKVAAQGNAVQYCAVPRGARGCAAAPVAVPFPGEGYNLGEVTVLAPAPGVVEIVVGRLVDREYGAYLARSADGGSTFAPGYRVLNETFVNLADRTADGRIAVVAGASAFDAGAGRADGADRGRPAVRLEGSGLSVDVATLGDDVFALGGGLSETRGYRLPGGADPASPGAWQPLAPQRGGRGVLATGPAGVFSMLDAAPGETGPIYAQRLEGAAWGPPVTIVRRNGLVFTLGLDQDAGGRLHGFLTDDPSIRTADTLSYVTSEDGGARWSSPALAGTIRSRLADLAVDSTPDGEAVVAVGESSSDAPMAVFRIAPSRVPVKTVRIGDAFVQVRSRCSGRRDVEVEVRASRAGRPVGAGSVLRGATFSSRTAPRRSARRYSARFRLRGGRTSTTVRVRLRPRAAGGRSKTVRLRALTCRGRL